MLFQSDNVRNFNCYSYAMGIKDRWLNCIKGGIIKRHWGEWELYDELNLDNILELFVRTDRKSVV